MDYLAQNALREGSLRRRVAKERPTRPKCHGQLCVCTTGGFRGARARRPEEMLYSRPTCSFTFLWSNQTLPINDYSR